MDRLRPALPLLWICAALLAVEASYGLCPQDDAFISFRYAANLARGDGLVFNPGMPPVEGYTNFLWTVLFAPFIAFGFDPVVVSTVLGMGFSVALLWSVWELSERHWLAPLFVACFPGLSLEAVQGLETVAFAFWVCQALRGGRNWAFWAGLAALTRPEGYAVFGLLWVWRRDRLSMGQFGALTVPHIAFRVWYYGDIVPNTFHAKVGGGETLDGSGMSRGLDYLGHQVLDLRWELPQPHLVVLFTLLVCGAIRNAWVRRAWRPVENSTIRDALCLSGFYVFYVLMVGGDFKETGRFVIPFLAPMAVLGTGVVTDWVGRAKPRFISGGVAVLMLIFAIPGWMQMSQWASQFHNVWQVHRSIGEFLGEREWPEADYILAVHGAGIIPFYSELPTLDMWGLNDAHIAQAPTEDFGSGRAGHERNDYAYVLNQEPLIILPETEYGFALGYPAWPSETWQSSGIQPPEVDRREIQLAPYPSVFGSDFQSNYLPMVIRCESCTDDHQWIHLWVLLSSVQSGAIPSRAIRFQCEPELDEPCAWEGDLTQVLIPLQASQ